MDMNATLNEAVLTFSMLHSIGLYNWRFFWLIAFLVGEPVQKWIFLVQFYDTL